MALWNPNQPPEDGLPPEEVRITALKAEPWPEDGRRVRIHLEMNPFLQRPNIEVTIADSEANEVAGIHIIESIDARMTFTMHIRGKQVVDGQYSLKARVFYPDIGDVDQKTVLFDTHETK